jgi:hypothetical protein
MIASDAFVEVQEFGAFDHALGVTANDRKAASAAAYACVGLARKQNPKQDKSETFHSSPILLKVLRPAKNKKKRKT